MTVVANINPLIDTVANACGVTSEEIVGESRRAEIVDARHLAIALIRVRFGWTHYRIAEHFGKRDHTTVMHAVNSFRSRVKNSERLSAIVQQFFPDAISEQLTDKRAPAFTPRQVVTMNQMIRETVQREVRKALFQKTA